MTETLEDSPQDTKDRHSARIARRHGDVADPRALLSGAEAADMNAQALFEQGYPDKAEAEGLRAQQLRADGEFLLEHSDTISSEEK